jgi:hypothetical protein
MQVIAAVVGRLSLAYEESAKSSYSDADGERRNKTNRLHETACSAEYNFAPRMREYVPRSWLSTPWPEPASKSLASGCLTSSDVADGSSRVARTARRTA